MGIHKAIAYFGSRAQLARRVRVSPQAVFKWINGRVPPERAAQIEILTKGTITRHELCPGFPWGNTPMRRSPQNFKRPKDSHRYLSKRQPMVKALNKVRTSFSR